MLGNGTTTAANEPVPVSGGLELVSIDSDFEHTCGITRSADAYCWGYAWNGQLGYGARQLVRTEPVRVAGDLHFEALTVGDYHTCGVTTDGLGFCWGSNDYGQLGADTDTQYEPYPILLNDW